MDPFYRTHSHGRSAQACLLSYLKAEEMETSENPPIGIILCSEKNETHVEYALGGLSNKVFVSRYLLHLPTKAELEAFLQRMRRKLER
jgi:YhcG PDDEXK nuclease domain